MAENPAIPPEKLSARHAEGLGELQSLSEKPGNGATLAHFRLFEELGRGGMGTVYRALDTLLDREVAVKVLSEELSGTPEFQERFIREAKIIARMADPNIPQIHFIGKAEGRLFFAMEWIDGRTLEDLIREDGPVPPARALDIAAQAARALQAAHRAGITHRDIKPSNLMLTREGVVKVLDFGIARSALFQGQATVTGAFMGTVHYASPEQAQGAPVDVRSDIYSLGATLFELLTGHPPFVGDNAMAVLTARLMEPAPEVAVEVAGSSGVRALVARMLATRPEDRFPDPGALLEAIQAVYPAPPVPARLSRRTMAFLTDLLLVGAPLVAIFIGFWAIKGYFITTPLYDSVAGRVTTGLVLFAWLFAYFGLLGARSGRTLGQRLQGIRVMKWNGEEASPRAMALRAAVWWGPVCLAMAIQRDWPPVLVSTPSGSEDYLLSNLPWILAQLWILLLATTAMLMARRRTLADWLSRTDVMGRSPAILIREQASAPIGSWRTRLGTALQAPRYVLNAAILLVWLAIASFVGFEMWDAMPWSWSPTGIYNRHTMFEKVGPDDPGWDRLSARFLDEFLRKGDSAVNPEVLSIERHPFLPLVLAGTRKPLIVENSGYGARVSYSTAAVWAFDGFHTYIPGCDYRVEELQPAGEDQARRWDEARRRIYSGSPPHFLRALMHQRLHQEGFKVLNPEAFVGLFWKDREFILVAWPGLTVLAPRGEERTLYLYNGGITVSPEGTPGGSVGFWATDYLPQSVLSAYAAEQDSAWGKSTESIEKVVKLE